MDDSEDINTIFRILDSDGSGYLNREKLQLVCPHLSSSEIDIIFNDLDTDHDNRISLNEFTHGFKELIQPNDNQPVVKKKTKKLANQEGISEKDDEDLTTNMTQTQINEVFNNLSCRSWTQLMLMASLKISFRRRNMSFDGQLKQRKFFSLNSFLKQINLSIDSLDFQEQIYDFYETLRHGSSESTEQFQSILEVFVGDIMKYRKEIKRLEDSFKREKEMNENYLRRIEEDQEREMRQVEEKIRKQEHQKFQSEREVIQQRASKQIFDLQANVQRLQTIEQCYRDRQSNGDSSMVLLREEISKMTQENQTLNSSLNDSLTTIAILKSDLQSLKSQLNERQTILVQEKQVSASNFREKELLQSNVRQLVEVNKTLRDENDALRATIDSNKSTAYASDRSLVRKRSMSRTGSILEAYWNNPKPDSTSPFHQTPHLQAVNSFDCESTDELGIHGNKSPSKLDTPAKSTSVLMTNNPTRNNTLNDSGLSLTTIRDATEFESDRDLQVNKPVLSRNSKQYRSMPIKRNNNETDSDDVFNENSFDRNNPKRWSQQRSIKRTSITGRSSTKNSVDQPARKTSGSTVTDVQPEHISANLPFDRMYKVVFCGDAAVGKSTLIMRLCKGKFVSNINSTLGVDFQNKQLELDAKRIAIQLWDTAGQERFRSIAKSYFRRCDGVILVYDATYERSFLNVREWIDTITESTSKKVSVMIVANKIDLRDQMRTEGKRVIEHADGAKLAREYQALFIETSAKDGTNSNESLIELARDMQCNEDLERSRTSGIDLDKTTKKSTCCGGRS